MAIIYDIDPTELIEEAAKELQKMEAIKPPVWASFIKTGHSKERPPVRDDWWYVRAAAVLRKVYRFGPIGVAKLRGMYGSKKNRGSRAEHSYKGSGNVIRKVLQQLEKAEFLRQGKIGIHKGRIITPKGKKFLDGIATKIKGPGKEVKVGKKEVKAEEPKEAKPKPEAKPKAKEAPKAEVKPKTEAKPEAKEKPKETKPVEEKKTEAKPEEAPKAEERPKEETKPKEEKTEPKNG